MVKIILSDILKTKSFLHVQAKHFARSGTVQHGHVFELCTVWKYTEKKKQFEVSLCEKRSNAEFFLVNIFLHSDWIRKDTKHLPLFSPNVGKYGPEKTPYLDTFHALSVLITWIFEFYVILSMTSFWCLYC